MDGFAYCLGVKGEGSVLVLFRVIRLNRLRLDDDGSIATGQRPTLGRDGASHVARRQSQRHRNGSSDSHSKVLDGFDKPLFLNIS